MSRWTPAKYPGLGLLSFREEAPGDSSLVEDLHGARVQTTRTRAGKLLARASFNDGDV